MSVGYLQQCLLFAVVLIASNIFETKQIAAGPLHLTGGMLTFPLCYIIVKLVCEVWGYRKAIMLVWLGFVMNFLFLAAAAIVDFLPGAEYWTNDAGFHAIFGLSARITLASFIAFLSGSFLNAFIMSRLKKKYAGKKLPVRYIIAAVAGELLDSIILEQNYTNTAIFERITGDTIGYSYNFSSDQFLFGVSGTIEWGMHIPIAASSRWFSMCSRMRTKGFILNFCRLFV
ncbi:MAG: queuosine precursor transporter [Bacteroidales bacterium]|nr:queuosine precursor transporter [Bacteroidales bacterium]